MDVLLVDPFPSPELEDFGDYTDFHAALEESDILTLHCPLNEETKHMIDDESLNRMKIGAMLVNTSRGALEPRRVNTFTEFSALCRVASMIFRASLIPSISLMPTCLILWVIL